MPRAASVLLVDDNERNLIALEAVLESLGQRLVRSHSGEEALACAAYEDFALIILDVQMPGMDGYETARQLKLRERSRYVPIIFLTANEADEENVLRGYTQGAIDYVVKPVNAKVLRSKVSAFVGIYLKQEEIKEQEAALRQRELELAEQQSEIRFRATTEVLPHAVLVVDRRGQITYANRLWLDYTRLTPPVAVGRIEALLDDRDRSRFQGVWEAGWKARAPFQLECRIRGGNLAVARWFLIRAQPDPKGDDGWILTATDIDDSKKVEEAFRTANEAKDAFLTVAAHELRTPLQAAKSYLHLARLRSKGALPAGTVHALDGIGRTIDRMARLVEELLDIGKLLERRMTLEMSHFDLASLVREVVERFEGWVDRINMEINVPDRVLLRGDRARVDQVVTNLVSNAVRYSPGGGSIRISVVPEGRDLHLSVRDWGVGVPPDKQAMIFERFGRAHGEVYGGIGLGLTIARGIVEQHGGRLWVESTGCAGEGSTFHVVLPQNGQLAAEPGLEG